MAALEQSADLGLPVPRNGRLRILQKLIARLLWPRLRHQVDFNKGAIAEIHALQRRLDAAEFELRRHDNDLEHHSSVLVRHEGPLARVALIDNMVDKVLDELRLRMDLAQRQNFTRIEDLQGSMRRELADLTLEFAQLPDKIQAIIPRVEELVIPRVEELVTGALDVENILVKRAQETNARMSEIRSEVRADVDRVVASVGKELAELRSTAMRTRRATELSLGEHQRQIARIDRILRSSRIPESDVLTETRDTLSSLFGSLSVYIEDALGPSFAEIVEERREYLDVLVDYAGEVASALDLQCGRGEWLTLLREAEIPARGIDSRIERVDSCAGRNLDVGLGIPIQHLRNEKGAAFDLITAFGVIEYLDVDEFVELVDLALEALEPGGVLLIESTDPSNLPGAAKFLAEHPKANRPVARSLCEVIFSARGFSDVESVKRPSNRRLVAPNPETTPWAPDIYPLFEIVNTALTSEPRYAVVGRRPA